MTRRKYRSLAPAIGVATLVLGVTHTFDDAAVAQTGPTPRALTAAPAGPVGTTSVKPVPELTPVTDAMLANPPAQDWLMWRRTLNGWGYSPLDAVNTRNVSGLQLAWTRPIQVGKQEGTPLVHDGVLFMPLPFDTIQALDATNGDLLWEHRRAIPAGLPALLPQADTNRNLAIWDNLIIDTSADDHMFALDAKTGKLVWETKVNDYRTRPSHQTSGPIVAGGKVISGRGCEPAGGPEACVLTAHDARTGKELWRTRTIPRPGEANDETWGGIPDDKRWHVGAWMVPSYDPDSNLLYFGTSVTSPAPKFALAGNDKTYLYHNSTLAIDATTGKIVWHYQHVVDHWDLDHTFERMIVDTAVTPDSSEVSWINPRIRKGERRRVITGIPGKPGIVYTLDAKTGEFLWARPTVEQNVVGGIDGATGAVTVNPDAMFTAVGQERRICPSAGGGKNWYAGAYSPRTNAIYMPLQSTCTMITAVTDKQDLATLYGYRAKAIPPEPGKEVGAYWAVSAATGRKLWRTEIAPQALSLMATGGGLIFGGDSDGRFRAMDDRTGKVMWETNLNSPLTGFPVTYAVNGRQYVVAGTGTALTAGATSPGIRTVRSNAIFVFALPERK